RPGAAAVAGNRDHAGRVPVTVGLERLAADAAGADDGLAPVPAVAGVVDPPGRLPGDRHRLDPAAGLGRVTVIADAGAGDVQVLDGGRVTSAGFLRPGPPWPVHGSGPPFRTGRPGRGRSPPGPRRRPAAGRTSGSGRTPAPARPAPAPGRSR